MILTTFASEEGPHISIAPEPLFQIGNFTITNSMLYGWICAVVIVGLFLIAARKIAVRPSKGLVQVVDFGADFVINNMMTEILGSRKRAVKYAPIFMALFFFIMFNNWFGLLPGVGEAIQYNGSPLLRPFTADLNATIAMACVGMFFVQAIAISESGIKGHLKHYFSGSLLNPFTYLMGLFEMFSELTRLLALGLRLFANIAIGEILIAIFAYLGGFFGPVLALPFTLVELFVAALQAYIFVVLCLAYLSLSTSHENHDELAAEVSPV